MEILSGLLSRIHKQGLIGLGAVFPAQKRAVLKVLKIVMLFCDLAKLFAEHVSLTQVLFTHYLSLEELKDLPQKIWHLIVVILFLRMLRYLKKLHIQRIKFSSQFEILLPWS